uniref:Uncharacterized protein n=1 Tax=Oryza brachyantha TaxID=4533 RepID=J3LHJ9_ORYBR
MRSCHSELLPNCCLMLRLLFPMAHRLQLCWSLFFPLARPSRRTRHRSVLQASSRSPLLPAPGRTSWWGTGRRSSSKPARGRATRRRGGRRTTRRPATRARVRGARARTRGTRRTRRMQSQGRRGRSSPVARGRPGPRRRGGRRDRPHRSASTRPSSDTAGTGAARIPQGLERSGDGGDEAGG